MTVPAAFLTLFAKPWVKYVAGGLVVALVVWFLIHRFHAWEDSLRQEGRDEMAAKVALIVKNNDQNNRTLEQSLQTMLDQYGQQLDRSIQSLDEKQKQSTQTITKIIREKPEIFNNPVCNTPDDVIAERNKIRAQGPQ